MKSTPRAQSDSLSPVDAIAILNDWGSRGLFRGKNFGTSIHLQSIEPTPCYHFCGCTQYERRSVRRAISPYYGGEIDDTGTPPSMWDMTVERPRHEFVNTSKNIPVPHTERLLTCEQCKGNRRIECALCEGSGEEPCRQCHGGRISCNGCGGSGSVQGQVTDYVYNPQTNSSDMVTRYVMHSCNSCGGYGSFSCNNCNGSGLVVCALCHGDGDLKCETCDEQGKVREYKLLNVVFEYQKNSETIGALEIPDEKLQQVAGVKIFQKEEDTITALDGINDPRLTNHALEFLSQFTPSSSIMLYQELTITKIPVFKVVYKKHFAGKQKVLWIYGNEHQVYFEGQNKNPLPRPLKIGAGFGKIAIPLFLVGALGIGGSGFYLYDDWSKKTLQAVDDHCEPYNLSKRMVALKIDYFKYFFFVSEQFKAQYPSKYLNLLDPTKAEYSKIFCDIADQWLAVKEGKTIPKDRLKLVPNPNIMNCVPDYYWQYNPKTRKKEKILTDC
jgi:hypothetical protein